MLARALSTVACGAHEDTLEPLAPDIARPACTLVTTSRSESRGDRVKGERHVVSLEERKRGEAIAIGERLRVARDDRL